MWAATIRLAEPTWAGSDQTASGTPPSSRPALPAAQRPLPRKEIWTAL